MAIDAGEVQLKFSGKDVGLSAVLSDLTKNISNTTALTAKLSNIMSRADGFDRPFLAGAQALARLDIAAGRTTDAQQRLSLALQEVNQKTIASVRTATTLQNIQNRAARTTAQTASAQARLALSTNNYKLAEQTLKKALQNTNLAAKDRIQLQTQLNRVTQQAAIQTQRASDTYSKMDRIFAGFNRFIGAGFALQGAAQGIGEFVSAANELEKVNITVRVLSGSIEEYDKILALARNQQQRFGGSMNEILQDMTGFIFTARTTGVEVDKLVNAARRLAILDPVQGMQGAAIALKELFSGEIRSLSQRFEIPRSTLHSINQLESGVDKMIALERVLDRMGLSQELLDEQSQSTAVAWDRMTGSAQDAKAAVGALIANMEGLAIVLDTVFSRIASGLTNFSNFENKLRQTAAEVVRVSGTYQEYVQNTEAVNKTLRESVLIPAFAAQIDQVTESFYNFAQAQAAVKASQEEGFIDLNVEEQQARIQQLTLEIMNANEALKEWEEYVVSSRLNEEWAESVGVSTEVLTAFKEELLATRHLAEELSPSLEGIPPRVDEIWRAVNAGTITVEEARGQLSDYNALLLMNAGISADVTAATNALTGAEETAAAARENLIIATNVLSGELVEKAYQEQLAQAQTERLALAEEELYNIAMSAVTGLRSAGSAALIMGQQFGIAQADAINLINTLRLLNAEKARAAADDSLTAAGYTPAQQKAIRGLGFSNEVVQSIGDSRQALNEYNYEVADTAGKVDILNQRLSDLQYGSEDYYKTLLKLKGEEEKLAKERASAAKTTGGGGGGGGGSSAASAAAKENEKLLKDKQKLYEDLEKAEEQYQNKRVKLEEEYSEKILKITEEFAEAQAEALEEQEQGKRSSRYDFYKGLDPFEAGFDTTPFQAAYETAFAKAQEIAQQGRYELSNEFLKLRQDQIEELYDLEKEINDIRTDSDLDEKEKKKRIAYLEGLKKLLEDAQKSELDSLFKDGDSNVQEYEKNLTEAQKEFAEKSAELADEYGKDVDKKLTKSEQFQTAIEAENALLEKQREIIAQLNQAQNTTSLPIPNTTNTPVAPTSTTQPSVPLQPVPITIPEGTLLVHDGVLNTTLSTIGSRLESKLDDLRATIQSSNDTVTRAVQNVERGINKITTQTLTSR